MSKIKIIREIPSKIKEVKKDKEEKETPEGLETTYTEDYSDFMFAGTQDSTTFKPIGSGNIIQSKTVEDTLPETTSSQSSAREEPRGQVYEASVMEIERQRARYEAQTARTIRAEGEMAPSLRRSFTSQGQEFFPTMNGQPITHEVSGEELSRKYEIKEEDRAAERAKRRMPWE